MASGDSLLLLSPLGSVPTSSNYATLGSITGGGSPAEAAPILSFDPSTVEFADWYCTMPRSYSNGGVTVTFYHSASATTGNIAWNAAFRRITDNTVSISTTFTYDFNEVVTTVSTDTGRVKYTALTFTNGADMDSVVAGDFFILRVKRNTATSGDSALDCSINSIEIKET